MADKMTYKSGGKKDMSDYNIHYQKGGEVPKGSKVKYVPGKAARLLASKRETSKYPKCNTKTGPARLQCIRDVYGAKGGATTKTN